MAAISAVFQGQTRDGQRSPKKRVSTVLWRAYLSTQKFGAARAVNARDRIGKGPWFNVERVRIAENLAHLHGDTLLFAGAET